MMNAALKLQPGQPELYFLRGYAHRSLGANRRAIEDLTITIAGRPDNGRAYYNRGAAYNALGEYRNAIADQDKAIQLAPHDPSRDLFYQERGIAFKKLGRRNGDRTLFLRALADFEEALRVNPRKGWAWHERGSVWLALEEPTKALAYFNKAEAFLAPEDRYWLYQDRADVKQRLGDYQGASEDRKRSQVLTEKR
jgi:tetratricopeptide (TPR) repeat protein